jgi:hypothetical protein
LARIDASRLNQLRIIFFNQIILDTPQLFQFIGRRPTLKAPEKCHMVCSSEAIFVTFPSQTSDYAVLSMRILCTAPEWQLSSLEWSAPRPCLPFPPLHLRGSSKPTTLSRRPRIYVTAGTFTSFAAVKNPYVCEKFVLRIVPALQELVGGRTTVVFPTLENIFLEGFSY